MKPPVVPTRIAGMYQIRFTPRLIAQFLALSFLALGAHELVHHLVARLGCGGWGTVSFWQFTPPAGCRGGTLVATAAGPLFTWLLIWGGRAMVRHGETCAGAMLIVANLPLARLGSALLGRGDEMAVARALVPGDLLWLPVIGLTLLLFWPPVEAVARALPARGRAALLLGALTVPLLWDAALRALLDRLLVHAPGATHGVPYLVIAAMAAALVVFVALRRRGPRLAAFAMISGQVFAVSGSRRLHR